MRFEIFAGPQSNDLDTQTWPRYGQDVFAYQNEVPSYSGSNLNPEQTDRLDRSFHLSLCVDGNYSVTNLQS